MIQSLLVPTLALDVSLLQRLADSIDYPIKKKVVINNGKPNALDEWKLNNPDWKVINQETNLGVAGSWNLAPKIFENDHWLIVNDDHEIQHGALRLISDAIDNYGKESDILYVNVYQAFDMFVWTRNAVNKFGLFDENFYPAYFEDWEMRLRFSIGKAQYHIISYHFPIKHGKPKPCGNKYMGMLERFKPINEDYFIRKWGTVGDSNPKFLSPFDRAKNPVWFWELESERRESMMEIWQEFFNDKEVSLY